MEQRNPKPGPAGRYTEEAPAVEEPRQVLSDLSEPVVHHPDGWYWRSADGRQEFGPFDSQEAAIADRHSGDPDDLEPAESLQEAEAELGISDWIDPDTGSLAEGMGHPHLLSD